MKSFTTPEYIGPIIDEIGRNYTPITDAAALKSLDCVVLLQKKKSRDCIAVRTPDKGTFIYCSSHQARRILSDLDAWAEAAETYTGELDGWKWNEQKRIMEAIRKAIIESYT